MKLYSGNTQDIPPEGADEEASSALLTAQVQALRDRLREATPAEQAELRLEAARTLLRLERGDEAWEEARLALDAFVAEERWQQAVEACEALFLAEQDQSLAALGQGIWLAVTFPIEPGTTIEMLRHVVDETPEDSDGAAVAAATAYYVADVRAEGKERENLMFYAGQMLSSVARRHSQVEGQEQFDAWMQRLELYEPEKFLVRLRNVVDVLVQDEWWIDRDAIHARLPDN